MCIILGGVALAGKFLTQEFKYRVALSWFAPPSRMNT